MSTKTKARGACSRALLVGLLLLVLLMGCYASLTLAGSILIVGDPLRRADALVLLSGGDQARVEEAVRLYKDGYAGLFVLTRTGEVAPGLGTASTQTLRKDVLALGVPSDGIVETQSNADSTYTEAVAVRDLLEERGGIDSCIIVTDPYHTLRTRLVYGEVFRGTHIQIIVRSVRSYWYRSSTWWLSAEGWRVTFSEYTKLAAFLLGVKGN